MKSALVTGGSGFVGRYVIERLIKDGWSVTNIDIQATFPRDARDFFQKDDTKFDLVVHLAAVVGGRAKIEGEPLSVAVDLSIDAEFYGWAIRTRPGHLVYFSSSAAYPIGLQFRGSNTKLREDHINLDEIENPDLSYGWSKLTGEILAKYAREAGLTISIFRPFSGYGTDQDLDYPFPSFIQRAKDRADPFQIWGDGLQVRDFIHIRDITEAVMAAADDKWDGVTNLGTGRPTLFLELCSLVTQEAGYKPEIELVRAKPSGVHYRVADITHQTSLGFIPKITLEQGIRMAYRRER